MTQEEGRECARAAWIACAVSLKQPDADREAVTREAHVHFERWWRAHRRTLPGFAQVNG